MQIRLDLKKNVNIESALDQAASLVQKRVRIALKQNLRDIQAEARQKHRYTARSAMLERSVDTNVEEKAGGTIIDGKAFLNTSIAKYGPWVHDGTAPHIITATKRQSLRWVSGGRFAYAKKVRHPGCPPDQFLYKALENQAESIVNRYSKAVDSAIKEAGL